MIKTIWVHKDSIKDFKKQKLLEKDVIVDEMKHNDIIYLKIDFHED